MGFRKSVIAAAAVVCTSAFAQNSVTVFGVVDATLAHGSE